PGVRVIGGWSPKAAAVPGRAALRAVLWGAGPLRGARGDTDVAAQRASLPVEQHLLALPVQRPPADEFVGVAEVADRDRSLVGRAGHAACSWWGGAAASRSSSRARAAAPWR